MNQAELSPFCDPIATWFAERIGTPTVVQRHAWPHIVAGRHTLVSAPTGSGKTLTAFLWALDRLLTEAWPLGATRVLYVSPLRALGNDIRRNLLQPLAELGDYFAAKGLALPPVAVATRSGDTTQDERRRMIRHPPEILITTPESLNILLTSASGRTLLGSLRTVILDEVHAVVGSKRGAHLITAVERLVPLCGDLQRLALSATIRPLEQVARWVGGYQAGSRLDRDDPSPRPVAIVSPPMAKRYDIEVCSPVPEGSSSAESKWDHLVTQLRQTIDHNRSTLIFANSRRMVEKIARMINEAESEPTAYSHHGALSREIRTAVEERLKAGELHAIVATNSLELGIDIGSIDEVALIQAPPAVVSAVQRVGRAGHAVDQVSRARFYPLYQRDLLQAAVMAEAVVAGDIEAVEPVRGPLDVLAQVILSMTAREIWNIDDLFLALRCAEPYHDLPRHYFDLVLEMLAGRYASSRIRSLRPMVAIDRVDSTVRARPGAERLIYMSGGTIPDRGYYKLRIEGSGALLGDLDEEFVWERSVGDTFTLGVQTWKIRRITHNDVEVAPQTARAAMAPFWRADARDRSFFLSEKVACFLEEAEPRLKDSTWMEELQSHHLLTPDAADQLRSYLSEQVAATGALPHRHRVVVEHTPPPAGGAGYQQIILHTFWGGRVNRPLAWMIAEGWSRRFGMEPQTVHDDDCIVITFATGSGVDNPFELVPPEAADELLQQRLQHTGFFGARFRQAAGCALLLPRAGLNRRTPLWLHRQRAKELMTAVAEAQDFPLVIEAWRACLHNDLEVDTLRRLLEEVQERRIQVHHVRTEAPSPFAANALWRQTNELMYADDRPAGPGGHLHGSLLRELLSNSQLRPRLDEALVTELVAKLQRLAAGYAPASAEELLHWVNERILIPVDEWRRLLEAIHNDHGHDPDELLSSLEARLVMVVPHSTTGLVTTIEQLHRFASVAALWGDDLKLKSATAADRPAAAASLDALAELEGGRPGGECSTTLTDMLSELLRFYGPLTPDDIVSTLALPADEITTALEELVEEQLIIADQLTADTDQLQVCDRDNLERALRLTRAAARPSFEPLSPDHLPLFLAYQQHLGGIGSLEQLQQALETLFGWPAPAELWETQLLPARLDSYQPAWLDSLLVETDLRWTGCGEHRLCFVLANDRELVIEAGVHTDEEEPDEVDGLLRQRLGRYPLHELAVASGIDTAQLTRRLWHLAWSGRVTCDSFAPVRQGVLAGFRTQPQATETQPGKRRARFDRWRSSRPLSGSWFALEQPGPPADPVAREEAVRDRARLLLDRYGVLFRELLERELPTMRWSNLFRSLRLMELSGEVVAGRFFEGVQGLQFASQEALRRLQQGLDEQLIWWINATDPASPCGLAIDGLGTAFPRRVASSQLVFDGRRLVLVSERSGKRLLFHVDPEHPRLGDYLQPLRVMLSRPVKEMRAILVETINDQPAADSPFRPALAAEFHLTRSGQGLRLGRRY